ncbi:MAG: adenylate kinase [Candidatus Marinimicrobia bacterium]|nr:adenylate kinase [Candidatus Neomarinimicrobiota bacterium]
MRLILLGPPGVGKGTQADRLKEYFHIIHLSTGDILRGEVESESHIGKEAQSFMDAGKLVPDEILLKMMELRLSRADCSPGYLLDGFPRTIPQAEGFDEILIHLHHRLNSVISLMADEDELVNRLVLRGKNSGRSDDTPEVIKRRQKIYWEQTAPMLNYYQKKDLVKNVNGIGTIPEITDRIIEALKTS